jgi:hypothetical protein
MLLHCKPACSQVTYRYLDRPPQGAVKVCEFLRVREAE